MKCAVHNCFCFGYSVEKVGSVLLRPSRGQFWHLSVLKLLIYYWEKSCKHFKSSKQIRRELKIQMFPHQNYESLEIKCNFQRPSSSESFLTSTALHLCSCCLCYLGKSLLWKENLYINLNSLFLARKLNRSCVSLSINKFSPDKISTKNAALCIDGRVLPHT